MKKCYFFVISLLSALLFLSCSLGLDPAKSGSTEVSFSVGDAMGERIIAPGTGYLYIRTVGGPTGDNGPFYGPFQLSAGSVFTTTEIPAGSYDGFGILYATEPLEGLDTSDLVLYIDKTFTQLMSMPDNEFIEFAMEDYPPTPFPDLTAFDVLIDGRATAEMLENVRIVAGQRNVIAVKLMPVIGENTSYSMDSILEYAELPGNEPTRTGRYFQLDIDPADPSLYNQLRLNYTVNGDMPFMGSITIYDINGMVLGSKAVNSSIETSGSINVAYYGQNTVFGFFDFTGNIVEMQMYLIE